MSFLSYVSFLVVSFLIGRLLYVILNNVLLSSKKKKFIQSLVQDVLKLSDVGEKLFMLDILIGQKMTAVRFNVLVESFPQMVSNLEMTEELENIIHRINNYR